MSSDRYDATIDRKNMELILDYEIQGSVFHSLYDILCLCGLTSLMGWYFGWKVNRKYSRYLQRGSVMDEIVAGRGPYGGFLEP